MIKGRYELKDFSLEVSKKLGLPKDIIESTVKEFYLRVLELEQTGRESISLSYLGKLILKDQYRDDKSKES